VKLEKITFYMVEESSTELMMFENGELDFGTNPPLPEIDRLKQEGVLTINPYLGTYYYMFNVTKPPFDNVLVRKALAAAIDRESIVKMSPKLVNYLQQLMFRQEFQTQNLVLILEKLAALSLNHTNQKKQKSI